MILEFIVLYRLLYIAVTNYNIRDFTCLQIQNTYER